MQILFPTLKKYLNSNFFIFVTYLYTIICWVIKNQIIAMIYYLLMVILIILTNSSRNGVVTLIMSAIINYRITTFTSNMNLIIIIVIIALPIILIDFFSTQVKYKNNIFYAMLIFLVANILSLININNATIIYGMVGILQIVSFCFLFLYFYNKKEKDFQIYISKNALALGISIAIEFIIYIFTYRGDILGKNIELGWGVSNSIAMTLLLIIPLTFYLYLFNQKNSFILFFVMIDILLIIMMLCKGAYLTLGIIFPALLVLSFVYAKNRKKLIFDLLLSFIILILIIILIFRFDIVIIGMKEYMRKMNDRGWFNDPVRMEIFSFGLSIFNRFSLFGAGSYTSNYYLVANGFSETIKHYHNYFVQTLATLGIVGLFSFVYYIFIIIKNCISKNYFNICVLISIIAMLIHGLVDNTWYNSIVMIIITIYLSGIFAVKSSSED